LLEESHIFRKHFTSGFQKVRNHARPVTFCALIGYVIGIFCLKFARTQHCLTRYCHNQLHLGISGSQAVMLDRAQDFWLSPEGWLRPCSRHGTWPRDRDSSLESGGWDHTSETRHRGNGSASDRTAVD
jgi:hypothetical protein